MLSMSSGRGPPLLPLEIDAFKCLIASCGKRKGSPLGHSFVKKTDIPFVDFSTERPCQTDLNLVECCLIGQFTGMWLSPKAVEGWVQRNRRPLVSDGICNHIVGRCYYVFVFESADERDLIF